MILANRAPEIVAVSQEQGARTSHRSQRIMATKSTGKTESKSTKAAAGKTTKAAAAPAKAAKAPAKKGAKSTKARAGAK